MNLKFYSINFVFPWEKHCDFFREGCGGIDGRLFAVRSYAIAAWCRFHGRAVSNYTAFGAWRLSFHSTLRRAAACSRIAVWLLGKSF